MIAYTSNHRTDHLLKLSNEVSRIAGTLARLSVDPGAAEDLPDADTIPADAAVTVEQVSAEIRTRNLRAHLIGSELFADPAWDILLGLFRAELAQVRIATSQVCAAPGIPPTTGLRWLNTLVSRGLCARRPDPHDARRVYVELTPAGSTAMRRYFTAAATL